MRLKLIHSMLWLISVPIFLGMQPERTVAGRSARDVPMAKAHRDITDTIRVAQDTIGIEEVQINREGLTPEEQYEQNKREYRIIYLHGDNKNLVQYFIIPPIIFVNVNKLYNHFSKTGRQARHLQKVLANDFIQDKIRETWYPLTAKLTKLEGQQLEDFRRYYQPDLSWWNATEEYERLDYVFKKLKNYQDSAVHIRTHLRLPAAGDRPAANTASRIKDIQP